jgi:hypothetical protein
VLCRKAFSACQFWMHLHQELVCGCAPGRLGQLPGRRRCWLSGRIWFGVGPRGAVRAAEELIRLGVADDRAGSGIPGEGAAEFEGEVGKDAGGARYVALLDVGNGARAIVDGIQEIDPMPAHGGGDMFFEIFLGFVLGIFLEFVEDVALERFSAAERGEIVAENAGFESPFVAVEGGAPLVFGVGGSAPGAMVPGDLEIAIIEDGGLGIGDIGFAVFVDEDAAGGGDAGRPVEVEHPANHVEHMDAHVTEDAVAVFGEGAPTARVHEFIEWAQRCGTGPHFVIEVGGWGDVRRILAGSHMPVAVDVDGGDFAEQARFDDVVAGVDEVGGAAALGVHLNDAVEAPGGGEHGLAFDDVDADWFFDVNVGAGFHGGDGGQRVPVIGGADEDNVEILFAEHFAVIAIGPRGVLRALTRGDHLGGFGQHVLVDIAERDDLGGFDLEEPEEITLAVPTATDEADAADTIGSEELEVGSE